MVEVLQTRMKHGRSSEMLVRRGFQLGTQGSGRASLEREPLPGKKETRERARARRDMVRSAVWL